MNSLIFSSDSFTRSLLVFFFFLSLLTFESLIHLGITLQCYIFSDDNLSYLSIINHNVHLVYCQSGSPFIMYWIPDAPDALCGLSAFSYFVCPFTRQNYSSGDGSTAHL